MKRPLIVLAASVLLGGAPQTADACSAPACWPGGFLPTEGAQVPANLPGLVWKPVINRGTTETPTTLVLATASDPTEPLPFTATPLGSTGDYLLVPDAPLVAGTAYVLRDESECFADTGLSVTFTTTATAPLPTTLGILGATYGRDVIDVATSAGSCSAQVDAAIVDLELELSSDALPWRDGLAFETLVDGQLWRRSSSINVRVPPGASWIGRGSDRLYRVCHSDDPYLDEGLSAGPHEVVMRATLPGSGVVVASQTVTVDLSCSGGVPPECIDNAALCGDNDTSGCDAGRGGSAWWLLAIGALLVTYKRRLNTLRHG